jgi:SAM-dependent methyltransferase
VFPVIVGIPDLRVDIPAWVDLETDRQRAQALAARSNAPAAALVGEVFRSRGGSSEREAAHRTATVLEGIGHLGDELDDWLSAATTGGRFLDLGCGPGQLLAAAARRGRAGIGVDVMLEWLVVARAVISEHGGTAVIAAAMAEALPLTSASVAAVVSLDTIEHVGDQRRYLQEIDRVVAPGGFVAMATPNRFSLAPEPHVNGWGVGWLPRSWQRPYAEWRSGKPYAFCRLLSVPELRRMLARETRLQVSVIVPRIPAGNICRFHRTKARLARWYNGLTRFAAARLVFQFVGPFFRVVARKPAG